MRPEANRGIIAKTGTVAGIAFAGALAYQLAFAPNAMADDHTADPSQTDPSISDHSPHVGDPLDTYSEGHHGSSETGTTTDSRDSTALQSAKNTADSPAKGPQDTHHTGLFNLPVLSEETSTAAPAAAATSAGENSPAATVSTAPVSPKQDKKPQTTEAGPAKQTAAASSSNLEKADKDGSASSAPPKPDTSTPSASPPTHSASQNHGKPQSSEQKAPVTVPSKSGIFDLPVPGKASSAAAESTAPPPQAPTPETKVAPAPAYALPITLPNAVCTTKIEMRWGVLHQGYDIAAPLGTPIYSATAGVVLYSRAAHGYGNWIVIQTSDGVVVTYGHMKAQDLLVKAGDVIKAGQLISRVGAEGQATGPHLHFQMNQGAWNGPLINPEDYLRQHGGLEICQFPPTKTHSAPETTPAPAPTPSPSPAPPPSSAAASSSSESAHPSAAASPDKQTPSTADPVDTGMFDLPVPGKRSTTEAPKPSPNTTDTGIFDLPVPGKESPKPVPAPVPPAPTQPEATPAPGLNQQQLAIIKSLNLPPAHEKFLIDTMAAALDMYHHGYNENPQAMVAQDIDEGGWGESELAAKYYNDFGMKAKLGTSPDKYVVMGTWEYGPNGRYWVPDAHFLRFNSIEDGLKGYDQFIKDRWWFADALKYRDDPSGYIQAFMNTDHGQMAWATSPTYYKTLMNFITVLRLNDIVAADK